MKISTKELTPALWDDVEKLFGPRGACAGCWCMFWRLEEGETFERVKGAAAKKRFRALVASGKAHGILAYAEGEPVGWCSFDRRRDYRKLDRAPSLAVLEDDVVDGVWSLPCFFIKAGWRGKGVARAMLKAALAAMKRRGAKIAEAYPLQPQKKGGSIPAAFAFTGVPALFEPEGFRPVEKKAKGKVRVRKKL